MNAKGGRAWSAVLVGLGLLVCAVPASAQSTSDSDTTPEPLQVIEPREAAITSTTWRSQEFGQSLYYFCHDEDFVPSNPDDASKLCALFDESTHDACPAVAKSCPWKEKNRWAFDAPTLPPELARVFVASIVIGLLTWFIVAMLRAGWEDEFRNVRLDSEDTAGVDLGQLPPARDQVLLSQASEAFQSGDVHRAAVLAHLAILRHLDDAGIVRFHPSKTNGDYARAIRGRRSLHRIFRQICRQTERIRFGDGNVEPAEIEFVLQQAPNELKANLRSSGEKSAGRGAVAMLLFASLGFFGCTEDLSRPYYSHAPDGMAALVALLRHTGFDVEISRAKLHGTSTENPPEPKTHHESLQTNRLPVPQAGVYVFRTSAAASRTWPEDVQLDRMLGHTHVVVIDEGITGRLLSPSQWAPISTKAPQKRWYPSSAIKHCWPQNLALAQLSPITTVASGGISISSEKGHVKSPIMEASIAMSPVLLPSPTTTSSTALLWGGYLLFEDTDDYNPNRLGCLYIFQGRVLLSNAALTRPENAAFVAAFFASLAGPGKKIVFVDRLDPQMGIGENKEASGRIFVASNMLPVLLQSVLTLVLIIIAVGAAFGPLRDDVTQSHKAFIEHVEALGRHYARGGNRGLSHSATTLARLVLMQHRHRIRGGQAGGWRALVQELADKHKLPPEDVRAALRLGTEGIHELGTADHRDPPPHSDRILKTLTTLLAGRQAGPE